MKNIFVYVVALCAIMTISEPVVAGEYDENPSKKEIRTLVAEYFEAQVAAAKAKAPVSISMELLSFLEWYLPLDEKLCEYTDKQMDAWKQKNDKKYSLYSDYITASIAVLLEENFEKHKPKLISYIYLDAVAEYSEMHDYEAATEMYYNYVIYTMVCSMDGYVPDHVSVWAQENPDRAALIGGVLNKFDVETLAGIIGNYFNESYSAISASVMSTLYVEHLEGIVDCYVNGEKFDMFRHYIVASYLVNLENTSHLRGVSKEWETEHPERAKLLHEALGAMGN